MSIAAIIVGLLTWLSVPPLYKKGMTPKHYRRLQAGCKLVGLGIIAAGVAIGFFR